MTFRLMMSEMMHVQLPSAQRLTCLTISVFVTTPQIDPFELQTTARLMRVPLRSCAACITEAMLAMVARRLETTGNIEWIIVMDTLFNQVWLPRRAALPRSIQGQQERRSLRSMISGLRSATERRRFCLACS